MNRYSCLFVAGLLAATIGLGAESLQGQNRANTPPPDAAAQPGAQRAPAPPSAQPRTPNTVTVTGCIQSAPMAAAGRPTTGAGATPSVAKDQRFVLNSARMTVSGDAPGAVGTTGTAATSYQLEGEALTISPHLNQRVEITGVIQASTASPTGAANAAPGSTAAGPTLRVSSVKMLASTCAPEASTPGTTGQTLPLQQPPRQPQLEPQPPQQQAPAPPPQP